MDQTYEDAWNTRQALLAQQQQAQQAHDAALAARDQATTGSPEWAQRDAQLTECRLALQDAAAALYRQQQDVLAHNELHGRALQANLTPLEVDRIENSRGQMVVQAYEAFDAGRDLGALASGQAPALPVLDPVTSQVAGQAAVYAAENHAAMYHYAAGSIRQALAPAAPQAPIEPVAPAEPAAPPFNAELARLQAEVEASRKDLAVAQAQEQAFQQLPADVQAQGRGHRPPDEVRAQLDGKIQARDQFAADSKPELATALAEADRRAQAKAEQINAMVDKTQSSRFLGDAQLAALEQTRTAELARVDAERLAAREAAVLKELQEREAERQRQMQLDADRQR